MSNQYFAAYSDPAQSAIHPLHGQASAQHREFADLVESCSTDSLAACEDGFLEGSKKPSQPNYQQLNAVGIDTRGAAPTKAPAAGSTGSEYDVMVDLRKSIGDVLQMLMGPTQRKNEVRMDEILSLIVKNKKENDQNIDKLTKQFAQLTLNLHEKTKIALARLDHRLNEFGQVVDNNRRETHGMMASEIAQLTASTDTKIQSVSGSIDERISMLTARINGDMNKTISELGQAIASVGDSVRARN